TSRRLPIARASRRFTTFEQAINNPTNATPTSQRDTLASADSLPSSLYDSGATKMFAAASSLSPPLYACRYAAVASSDACASDTPGLRRTTTSNHCACQVCVQSSVLMETCRLTGTHTSTRPSCGPVKPFGATPTIVNGTSASRIVLPSTAGSPPYTRRQSP